MYCIFCNLLFYVICRLHMAFVVTESNSDVASRVSLYESGEFSDVTIICESGNFKVHRFALEQKSAYFRNMLKSCFKESSGEIKLKNVSADILLKILPHFYGATITVSYDDINDVLRLADMWFLDSLKEHCERQLPHIILQDNTFADEILGIARMYNCSPDIIRECEDVLFMTFNYLQQFVNGKCLSRWDKFLSLSPELLMKYFTKYNCKIQLEEQVLLLIQAW